MKRQTLNPSFREASAATRAGRRRGATTATWVNRFAFLFFLFLERDRSYAIPVWFAHVHLRRALGDDAGTTTVIAWGSLAFYIFNF